LPVFCHLLCYASNSQVVLLEGNELIRAALGPSTSCGIPGVTALEVWKDDSRGLDTLPAPACRGQRGFVEYRGVDSKPKKAGKLLVGKDHNRKSSSSVDGSGEGDDRAHIDASNAAPLARADLGLSLSPRVGGLDGGGWTGCYGIVKSELEQQGRGGCRHLGLYFFDAPMGQAVTVGVAVPTSAQRLAPPTEAVASEALTATGGTVGITAYRVSLSLLVSYENFGDVLVRLHFPSGNTYPEQPSLGGPWSVPPEEGTVLSAPDEYDSAPSPGAPSFLVWYHGSWHARICGWHGDHTSVPELHTVAIVPAPLPESFNVTITVPDPSVLQKADKSIRSQSVTKPAVNPLEKKRSYSPHNLKPSPSKENAKSTITGVIVTPVVAYL